MSDQTPLNRLLSAIRGMLALFSCRYDLKPELRELFDAFEAYESNSAPLPDRSPVVTHHTISPALQNLIAAVRGAVSLFASAGSTSQLREALSAYDREQQEAKRGSSAAVPVVTHHTTPGAPIVVKFADGSAMVYAYDGAGMRPKSSGLVCVEPGGSWRSEGGATMFNFGHDRIWVQGSTSPVAEPEKTAPWPAVERFTGPRSAEGEHARLWVRLGDTADSVEEYVKASSVPPKAAPTADAPPTSINVHVRTAGESAPSEMLVIEADGMHRSVMDGRLVLTLSTRGVLTLLKPKLAAWDRDPPKAAPTADAPPASIIVHVRTAGETDPSETAVVKAGEVLRSVMGGRFALAMSTRGELTLLKPVESETRIASIADSARVIDKAATALSTIARMTTDERAAKSLALWADNLYPIAARLRGE